MNDDEIVARFSPGPWWGFNGVDHLELSGDVLTLRHYYLLAGYKPRRFALTSIESVSREIRGGRLNRQSTWLRMTLRIDGRNKTFTGHVDDGKPFATALAIAVTRARGEQAECP